MGAKRWRVLVYIGRMCLYDFAPFSLSSGFLRVVYLLRWFDGVLTVSSRFVRGYKIIYLEYFYKLMVSTQDYLQYN